MPDTLVNDALPPPGPDEIAGGWVPRNADGRQDGPITVRDALVRSKNLATLRLLQHVGTDEGRDWLARFGFDPARWPAGLTTALGSGTTTPMQLAQAYAVLAQGGYPTVPVFIERITDASGMTIYQPPRLPPHDPATRVIPERNAFIVGSLLQDVLRRGTGAAVLRALPRDDLFGKTGTTNDAVDAWFAGYQPTLVAVAWIGYDEPRSLGDQASGAGLALPVWTAFMGRALEGTAAQPLLPPEGVTLADGEWRYAEEPAGGRAGRIGFEAPAQPPLAAASMAGAASAP
ncbi:MAG: hypothetical protein RL456_3254, partial [Pseudomonadota bacterium]|jgi:penicillin-binding protein 1A